MFATDSTGTIAWSATYLPFGGVHTSTGSNSDLRFPGQWFQSESGLHQNWMRDYDPTLGRYIQADPLGIVPGGAVYNYTYQNPMFWTDPTGEIGIPGVFAGAAIGGTAGYLSSGCWQGAVAGALAGGAAGGAGAYLLPAGAAALGVTASASGQIAANYIATGCGCDNEEPIPFAELAKSPRFWFISLGGGAGAGAGTAAGNRAATYVGNWLFGRGPMFRGMAGRGAVEGAVSEGIAATGAGLGEYGGSALGGVLE